MKAEFLCSDFLPGFITTLFDNSTFNVLYVLANCLRAFQRVELLDHYSWCAFRGFMIAAI